MEQLKKRYGLITAICMVVGVVVGSGIFFKAQNVLQKTGGNAFDGIIAWLVGGAIMVVIASTFAIMATKYEKVNGVVDYAESLCGNVYAYYLGWFMSIIYYPAMTSVLAWVSARYTMVLVFGVSSSDPKALFSPECIAVATFYLIVIYFINTISPRLAGKFQVATTVAKLIPLAVIALIGTFIGLANGTLASNFVATDAAVGAIDGGTGIFPAICSTVFAYEGWIIATTINSELKNSKKNLPIALFFGTLIIVAIYVLFYIGVLGLSDSASLANDGTSSAFNTLGTAAAAVINFFVIISCLGTLNGLMLGCTRGFYSLAARKEGINPKIYAQVDKETNIPNNSAALALLACVIWLLYFLASQFFGWFGEYGFDSSELPIVTIYPLYVPILISFMIKEKGLHPFKRFVLPALSIAGCVVMVVASVLSHKMSNVYYLVVFAVVMEIGAFVYFYRRKKEKISLASSDEEE